MPPTECGTNEMMCPGGMDPEGCPMPDMCIPADGPMGYDTMCPNFCPATCGMDEMLCPGPIDSFGCMMPDTCMPMMNGDCPSVCPYTCPDDMMTCSGGMDSNGCMMPDYCVPEGINCEDAPPM